MPLHWKVDECAEYYGGVLLRGWCHHAPQKIVAVHAEFPGQPAPVPVPNFGYPSADVALLLGPSATNARFEGWMPVAEEALGRDFALRFTLEDGSVLRGESVLHSVADGDPYFLVWPHFLERLRALPAGGTVLEIGSRARSAVTRRDQIPSHLNYVGCDILAGTNVDVVADAHELAAVFGRGQFVAAMSFSVFEHLAMPWKVALELNHVLQPGGLVFTSTHQTWPLHEEPWDFWRFSQFSWQTLFNAATGFELVETACGEPAHIHGCRTNPVTRKMHLSPAYLGSASIVRKTGDTALQWPVPLRVAAAGNYPAGEMSAPPS
jgi:hypothetical protein